MYDVYVSITNFLQLVKYKLSKKIKSEIARTIRVVDIANNSVDNVPKEDEILYFFITEKPQVNIIPQITVGDNERKMLSVSSVSRVPEVVYNPLVADSNHAEWFADTLFLDSFNLVDGDDEVLSMSSSVIVPIDPNNTYEIFTRVKDTRVGSTPVEATVTYKFKDAFDQVKAVLQIVVDDEKLVYKVGRVLADVLEVAEIDQIDATSVLRVTFNGETISFIDNEHSIDFNVLCSSFLIRKVSISSDITLMEEDSSFLNLIAMVDPDGVFTYE